MEEMTKTQLIDLVRQKEEELANWGRYFNDSQDRVRELTRENERLLALLQSHQVTGVKSDHESEVGACQVLCDSPAVAQ